MWRPLALLICLQASLGVVRRYNYNLLPDVLKGTPWQTAKLATRMQCASNCSKTHYVYCTGYSYTPDGTCHLHPTYCWNTEPSEAQPGVVSYARPTTHVWSCQNGGIALNDTCYFRRHSATPVTWQQAQIGCGELGMCARLAQPKDRLTYEFLMRFSRANDAEWLGSSDDDGDGLVTNMDGSRPSWQPQLDSHAPTGPVLLPAGAPMKIHRVSPEEPGVHRYICEAPHDCRLRQPCPGGWLLLHRSCYNLFTEALPWDEANAHCSRQGPYGRLADIGMAHWRVLWEHFFQSSGGNVYLGYRDVEIEGRWANIHNRTGEAMDWIRNQPDNAGGDEDCMEMIGDLANDVNCANPKPFLCRVHANSC